ncbi:MAG: galactosyltransferase-related protein [Verrucomicrobiales bacterium]
MKTPTVSYCTAVMNRTHHLKLTLPSNLAAQRGNGMEFVIANYGSRDDLDEWIHTACAALLAKGVVSYVCNRRLRNFHMPRAKNMAHRAASGDIVCNLDADNFLGGGFTEYLRRIFKREPDSLVHATGGYSAHGRIALLRHHFEEVGGYNESFEGWGNEDYELINRACSLRHLTPHECTSPAFARCLEHDDADRMRNFPTPLRAIPKEQTRRANEQRAKFQSPAWRRGLLIPRLIHLVVLPGETSRFWNAAWCSWQKWHPGWEFRIWTEDEAASLIGPPSAALVGEPRRAWLQCRLLYELGGVAVHPALNCARPLDSQIRDVTASVVPQSGAGIVWLAAGFRRHSLFWDMLRQPGFFQQADSSNRFHELAARHHWRELPPPGRLRPTEIEYPSSGYFVTSRDRTR